jgi:hypothetical protein
MPKAISSIIGGILMLVITIGIAGLAYGFIYGLFTSRTAVILTYVDFHNGDLIVRNDGTSSVAVKDVAVYASNYRVSIKSDKDPIPAGGIATLTILDSYYFSERQEIRVTAPGGNSFSITGDFGKNDPLGESTWYAKIGKHTGWGINLCGWGCNDWVNTAPDNSWRWTPNIVAWYRFDEGSGTIAQDETLRNNGTLVNGPQWVDGKDGKALSFDGVDDYITIPDSPSLSPTSGITISAWVRLNAAGTNWQPISFKEGPEGRAWWFGFFPGNPARIHWSNGGLSSWDLSCDIPSALNTWRYIVVTYQSGGIGRKIFVDGTLICSDTATGNLLDTSGSVYIGGGGWQPINGTIDEVRIYNRALSEEEIKLLYQQGIGKFASPASWDASSCPVKVYSGYFVCCMCEDSAHNCAGCEIAGWFKKYITIPSGVGKVWMKYSTDDPIKIYVNGQLAYERGCCCNPCDPLDLTPLINKGSTNLITVKFYEGCWCGYFGGNIWYDNLLDNAGFEEGTWGNAGDCCCGECSCTAGASCSGIAGGSYCTCPSSPEGSCQYTSALSTDAEEGRYSLNLTGRNACACNARKMISYTIGSTYKLSFWYKHVQGPDCPRYCMWVEGRNVCDPTESLCQAWQRDGNWHYYEKNFTVQPGTTGMNLHLYAGDGSNSFSTNLYDDVRIVEVS